MTIRLLYSTGDIKERRCEVTDKMMDALFKAISRRRPGGEGMRDALTMLRDATVILTLTPTPTLALTLTQTQTRMPTLTLALTLALTLTLTRRPSCSRRACAPPRSSHCSRRAAWPKSP